MTETLMVGVSGVRGIVDKDLTPEIVSRWARAFGRLAAERKPLVVVGRDSRPSGPRFAQAVHEGLIAAGCDVIDVGLVPTPTIQLAVTYHHAGGGIAVTASHNPSEWNALKFIGADGIFLDGPEGLRVRDWAASGSTDSVKRTGPAPAVTPDGGAIERHIDSVLALPAVDVKRFASALPRGARHRGAGASSCPRCSTAGVRRGGSAHARRFISPCPEPIPEHPARSARRCANHRRWDRGGPRCGPAGDRDDRRPIGEDYTAFAVRAVLGDPTAAPAC